MIRNKKLLIFDLDGTLIDSIGIWNEVDRRLAAALGGSELTPLQFQARRDRLLRTYSSRENPYLEYCRFLKDTYQSDYKPEQICQMRQEIATELLRSTVDYKDGAAQVLQFLKHSGFPLVIASTTRKSSLDIYRTQNKKILQKAALDQYFTRMYTKEDVHRIKPDPEIYFRILNEFHVLPEECLVFEDSLVGVEAAKNAKIEVAVLYDPHSDPDRASIEALADYSFPDHFALYQRLTEESDELLQKPQ